MDRVLARLERRFGWLGIPGLARVIVGGMGIVFILMTFRAELVSFFLFDLDRIMGRGGARYPELWRLVSFIFIPRSSNMLFFLFFELPFSWMILNSLEDAWGSFKLTLFYFVGIACTVIAAIALGGRGATSMWIQLSALFAFATLFPNYQILLYLVLPLKMKWAALLGLAVAIYDLMNASWVAWVGFGAAMVNYFLFCGATLFAAIRGQGLMLEQASRRAAQADAKDSIKPTGGRTCAICGAKEDEGADIRVCSCEKCGGSPRNLCLPHARNH